MNIACSATLNGDTLNGTMAGGEFSREFTARRSNSTAKSVTVLFRGAVAALC